MAAVRRAAAGGVLAISAILLTSGASLAADPSPDPSLCQGLPPLDLSRIAARVACDVTTSGPGGPAQDVQQSAGQAVVNVAETTFSTWLAKGAIWILQSDERRVLGPQTTPSLDANQVDAFAQVYGRVVGVALAVSLLLVLIAIIEATLTQRPGAMRRIVVGSAVSGIALGAVPVGTALLAKIVDDLSQYVIEGQSTVVPHGLDALVLALNTADPLTETAAFAMAALGILVGGGLLWLELVTRESLIYLFIGVAPLACAAVQWPRLEGVLRQVLFAGVALIVSKLVIAIALVVGFAVLAGGSGLENLLGGMFLLAVAALMPLATARVLPVAADELTQNHHGRLQLWARNSTAAVSRSVAAVATGGASGLPPLLGMAVSGIGVGKRESDGSPRPGTGQQGARGVAATAAGGGSPAVPGQRPSALPPGPAPARGQVQPKGRPGKGTPPPRP